MPSIFISPLNISIIREIDKQIVLLPAPVRPTTPIFSPGRSLNVNLSKTISVLDLYRKETFWNFKSPFSGQLGLLSNKFVENDNY